MPELPEVETVKRGLVEFIGQKLTKVDLVDSWLRQPIPSNLNILEGKILSSIERRAKYIIANFEGQEIAMHLGMTGQALKRAYPGSIHKHDKVGFIFGSKAFYINDARRFGLVDWKNSVSSLKTLGLEPLDVSFTLDSFSQLVLDSKTNIKNFLFDQTKVVGLGNIYINEALYQARISPFRTANSLNNNELKLLHKAIVEILTKAVELKGSSFKDYFDADGNKGGFQNVCQVYAQEGKLRGDGTMVVLRAIQNGRSTFYVDGWQK